MGLSFPPPPVQAELDVVGKRARFPLSWLEFFRVLWIVTFDVQNSGATADRPTENIYVGKLYFDTDLGIPVWWNGTDWIDATGAVV